MSIARGGVLALCDIVNTRCTLSGYIVKIVDVQFIWWCVGSVGLSDILNARCTLSGYIVKIVDVHCTWWCIGTVGLCDIVNARCTSCGLWRRRVTVTLRAS